MFEEDSSPPRPLCEGDRDGVMRLELVLKSLAEAGFLLVPKALMETSGRQYHRTGPGEPSLSDDQMLRSMELIGPAG